MPTLTHTRTRPTLLWDDSFFSCIKGQHTVKSLEEHKTILSAHRSNLSLPAADYRIISTTIFQVTEITKVITVKITLLMPHLTCVKTPAVFCNPDNIRQMAEMCSKRNAGVITFHKIFQLNNPLALPLVKRKLKC